MSTPVPSTHRVPMSFSPRLAIEDPLAAHWLRDVTLRLRREICWLWRERGVLAGLTMPVSALPPFTDRLAATLDLARYDEEKRAFFVQDATAGYLTPSRTTVRWVTSPLSVRTQWAAVTT